MGSVHGRRFIYRPSVAVPPRTEPVVPPANGGWWWWSTGDEAHMNKNVAGQKITLLAIDVSTNTPKTGDAANLTAYVSKDDGAVTVLTDTTATEKDATNALGLYDFDVSQTESNADKLVFSGKSSTANIRLVPITIYTRPANFSTLTIASNAVNANVERWAAAAVAATSVAGVPEVDVTHWLGTAAATPTVAGVPEVDITHFGGAAGTFAGGRPEVNTTHWIGTAAATPTVAGVPEVDVTHFNGVAGTFASGRPEVNTSHVGGTLQTAGDIIGDTNDIQARLPAALVSGRIDASVGAMASNTITATALASDAVSEMRCYRSGTADSGSETTMVDNALDQADVDYWKGAWIVFTNSTKSGLARLITGFDPTTDTITFHPALPGTLAIVVGDTYEIWVGAGVDLRSIEGGQTDNNSATLTLAHLNVNNGAGNGVTFQGTTNGLFCRGTSGNGLAARGDTGHDFASNTIGSIEDAIVAIDDFLDTEVAAIKAKTDSLTFTTANKVDARTFTNDDKTGYSIGTGGIAAASFAAGAIDAAAIAADAIGSSELAASAVDEILDEQIGDSTITLRQALKLLVATLGGKLAGAATTTVTIRNAADTVDVVTATVDASGNRTAVTLSL